MMAKGTSFSAAPLDFQILAVGPWAGYVIPLKPGLPQSLNRDHHMGSFWHRSWTL